MNFQDYVPARRLAGSDAAPRVVKGIPKHPVPVMILARFAVDLQHQGAGLGKALLKDIKALLGKS